MNTDKRIKLSKSEFKIKMQEARAQKYLTSTLIPDIEAKKEDWKEAAKNTLQKQAVHFIGKTLIELKTKQVTETDWLLEQLTQTILEKWQKSVEVEEKETFKKKMLENFPNSELANKLAE